MILDQNWNGAGARGRRLPAISKGEWAEMANDWWVPRKVHGDWQQRRKCFFSGMLLLELFEFAKDITKNKTSMQS